MQQYWFWYLYHCRYRAFWRGIQGIAKRHLHNLQHVDQVGACNGLLNGANLSQSSKCIEAISIHESPKRMLIYRPSKVSQQFIGHQKYPSNHRPDISWGRTGSLHQDIQESVQGNGFVTNQGARQQVVTWLQLPDRLELWAADRQIREACTV